MENQPMVTRVSSATVKAMFVLSFMRKEAAPDFPGAMGSDGVRPSRF
jgi:hypothetical protein